MDKKILEWLLRNQRSLLISMGGLIIFFLLLGAGFWWQSQREVKAFQALEEATKSEEVSSSLNQVIDDFSFTKAASLAHWKLALNELKAEKNDAAKLSFEKLYEKVSSPILRVIALYGIAQAQSNSNKFEEAALTYLRASKEPGNLISHQSQYLSARHFELAGNQTKAMELYGELMNVAELSPEIKKNTMDRQLWLSLQEAS